MSNLTTSNPLIMKKNLFLTALVGAMVLTGCSKSEILETDLDRKAIGFENFMHRATRATEVTASTLQTNGFKVSARYNSTSWYFQNLEVSYADSKYSTSYYWPESGTMNFYAVYPKQNIDNSLQFVYSNTDANVDIVTASATANCATYHNANPAQQVALEFGHALTQVYFSAKLASTSYKCEVSKIEVICNKEATYTFGSGFGTPTTQNTYTYFSDAQNITTTASAVIGSKAANSLMLIPQSGATVKVYYTSIDATNNQTISDFSTNSTCKSFTIPAAWLAGKTVKYDMTLPVGANPIEFTATVTSWDESTSNIELN